MYAVILFATNGAVFWGDVDMRLLMAEDDMVDFGFTVEEGFGSGRGIEGDPHGSGWMDCGWGFMLDEVDGADVRVESLKVGFEV